MTLFGSSGIQNTVKNVGPSVAKGATGAIKGAIKSNAITTGICFVTGTAFDIVIRG